MAKKKFKDLTIKGQKRRIVEDAITQIKIGKFIVTEGTYFARNYNESSDWIASDTNLKNWLLGDNKCECCAKGSLFSACVMNVNKVNGKDSYQSESFQKSKLKKWFSSTELDLIEAAFEKGLVMEENKELCTIDYDRDDIYVLKDITKKAIRFGKRYKNETNRLLAILTNIKENGSFRP